jgi:hypothetical protein
MTLTARIRFYGCCMFYTMALEMMIKSGLSRVGAICRPSVGLLSMAINAHFVSTRGLGLFVSRAFLRARGRGLRRKRLSFFPFLCAFQEQSPFGDDGCKLVVFSNGVCVSP